MINNTQNWVQYVLNGVQDTFTYPFKIISSDELIVIVTNKDTGIETVLKENIDYTITGAGNDTGGTVILVEPGLYGYDLTLIRKTDLYQRMNLINGGTIDADALETSLDKIVITLQDFDRRINNSLHLNRSSLINGLECEDKVKHDATIVVDPTGTKLRMGMSIAEIIQAALYQASIGLPSWDSLSDISPNAGIITAGKLQNAEDTTYFDLDRNELVLGDGLSFKNHLLSIKGTIEIVGATGYDNVSDRPTSINDINVTEGIKLSGIQEGADVTATSEFVATTYPTDKADLQAQIDGKIISWFQEEDPSLTWEGSDAQHIGDFWYHDTLHELKRWEGTAWSAKIEDSKALTAYEVANTAQDTADHKRRVFIDTPYPPYDVGDLWSEGTEGDIKKCITAKSTGAYDSVDWELASKYDKTSENKQSVTWLTDAGLLVTANDLDDVPNGTQYGRVNTTAISGGKIVLSSLGVTGTLPATLSEAKCTDPNADNTASNPQSKSWLTDAASLIEASDLVNGANLCYNSGFTAAYAGWFYYWSNFNPVNVTYGVDLNADWTLKYGHTFWAYQSDCQGDQNLNVQFTSEYIHIEPDHFYCLSAYTGAHRCRIEILIGFYSTGNALLGYGTTTYQDYSNDAEKAGGVSLADYKRNFIISKADYPTAAFARITFLKRDTKAGDTDSYMFITNVMFSEVTASQTLPVAYQPRGDITAAGTSLDTAHVNGLESTTIIEGGKIGTGLVVADSIYADSVHTEHILAGAITADSVGANKIITQTANVGDLVIDTLNLKGNSVTVPVSVNITNEIQVTYGNEETVISLSNFSSNGGMVLLLYTFDFWCNSEKGYTFQLKLHKNDQELWYKQIYTVNPGTEYPYHNYATTYMLPATTTADTYSMVIEFFNSGVELYMSYQNLTLIGLQK